MPDDDELQQLIVAAHDGFVRLNSPDVPLTIDGDLRVPWQDVISVMNISKRAGMKQIEFAYNVPSVR